MYTPTHFDSYSNCPYSYAQQKVFKTVKFVATAATEFGNRMHKEFELYVADNMPLSEEFAAHVPMLEALRTSTGAKHVELKLAIDKAGYAVPYLDPKRINPKPWDFNPDAYIGCIVDLLIDMGDEGMALDYKSGKSAHPAVDQMEIIALATLLNYPNMQTVKTGLLYVIVDDMHWGSYTRDDIPTLTAKWLSRAGTIDEAKLNVRWPKRRSGLCSWCQVEDCENRK